MRLVWQWIWAHNTKESSGPATTISGVPDHVGLFRYPTLDGRRLGDIARQMQITKQSVHEFVGHLEARGYLVREPDPADRRARIVRLTARGHQLESVIRTQASHGEDQIAAMLGQRRFAQLRQALDDLVAKLPALDHGAGANVPGPQPSATTTVDDEPPETD